MIEIERFDHISMAVPELGPQIALMERLFGFELMNRFEEDDYFGASLTIPGDSGVRWEIIAPNGPESFLHRFLASSRGPGLHHVAIEVRSTNQAAAAIRALEAEPFIRSRPAEGQSQQAPADQANDDPVEPSAGEPPATEEEMPDSIYLHPQSGGRGFLWQLNNPSRRAVPEAAHLGASDATDGNTDLIGAAAANATNAALDNEVGGAVGGSADGPSEGQHDVPGSLGIVRLDHLGHVTPDRHGLASWYERLFGCRTVWESAADAGSTAADGDSPRFATRIVEAPMQPLRFEAIEPSSPDSFLGQYLAERGEGMHHITFEVGDWPRALAACRAQQIDVVGMRSGVRHGARWSEAFLRPQQVGGILVQLFWQEQPGTWI